MNKLERLIGIAAFRKLPVTIQLTEGRPVKKVFHFSMKAANSDFHQTHERALQGRNKPISKIIKPIIESDAKDLF